MGPKISHCSTHRFLFLRQRPTGLTFGIVRGNLVVTAVLETSMGDVHGVKEGDVILLPVGFKLEHCLEHINALKDRKRPLFFEVIRPFTPQSNYSRDHSLALSRAFHRIMIDDPTPVSVKFKLHSLTGSRAREMLFVTEVKDDTALDVAGLMEDDIMAVPDRCGVHLFRHSSPPWTDPEHSRPLMIDFWRPPQKLDEFTGESLGLLRWKYGVKHDNPFCINVSAVLDDQDSTFHSDGSDVDSEISLCELPDDLTLSSSWCATSAFSSLHGDE